MHCCFTFSGGLERQAALPALLELPLNSAILLRRYSADKVGQYELAVNSSQDGEPLAGSPFSLTVIPAELSPSHCTAELAHDGSCLTAGVEASVRVHAKDHHGNTVRPSGIHFAFSWPCHWSQNACIWCGAGSSLHPCMADKSG